MNYVFKFILVALLTTSAPVFAQGAVGGGGDKPAPLAPDYSMPAGKIYVDLTTLPKRQPYRQTARVKTSCVGTYASCNPALNVPNRTYSTTPGAAGYQNSGAVRVQCSFSHVAFDDPIVWRGQAGRTHLHAFYGNTTTGFGTDPAQMATVGFSTCTGGLLNRTGYWVPTMIYECPVGSTNGCTLARHGEVIAASTGVFYYKIDLGFSTDSGGYGGTLYTGSVSGTTLTVASVQSGPALAVGSSVKYTGMLTTPKITALGTGTGGAGTYTINQSLTLGAGTTFQTGTPATWLPAGLRMIAGSATATSYLTNDQFAATFDYTCGVPGTVFQNIPTAAQIAGNALGQCAQGGTNNYLQMSVNFPSCWDGVNLDSPNHQSHMKYVHFYEGCNSATHPNVLPVVELRIRFYGMLDADIPYLSLSSDPPRSGGQTRGWTAHADWANGWDQTTVIPELGMTVTDAFKKECHSVGISPTRNSDCHADLLGNPNLDNANWWTLY